MSPALAGGFSTTESLGKPIMGYYLTIKMNELSSHEILNAY